MLTRPCDTIWRDARQRSLDSRPTDSGQTELQHVALIVTQAIQLKRAQRGDELCYHITTARRDRSTRDPGYIVSLCKKTRVTQTSPNGQGYDGARLCGRGSPASY